jgi:leucyl/phenylalanyl-tRNA---protein transferase
MEHGDMNESSIPLTTRWRFPRPETADEDGLVAVGGDMKPGTLLLAYRNGIFPWTSDPITWWSPDPRAVIEPDGLHIPRSLAKFLRHSPFTVSFDRAFRDVMEGCAAPRPGREETWISPRFLNAYTELHRLGYAHSVECRLGDRLVGVLYSVTTGGLFAGESMFSTETNASKTALVALAARLVEKGFPLFDTQMVTPVTGLLGAHEIPRAEYLRRLREAVKLSRTF